MEGLEQQIDALAPWHYRFEFPGGTATPVAHPKKLNRHAQRQRYFFDALLRVCGGSLEGRRVLDLGCNAGYWALKAIHAGADYLLGVDGRQHQLDQARLVFAANQIDPARFRFEQANIFEHPISEHFDTVLCLGLMYHIAKPTELFEIFERANADLVVIDTVISCSTESVFEVRREKVDNWLLALDYETVLIPSRRAIVDLAAQFGYRTVPLALNMTDLEGLAEYRDHWRLAFICSKRLPLDMLDSEPTYRPQSQLAKKAIRRVRRRVAARTTKSPDPAWDRGS